MNRVICFDKVFGIFFLQEESSFVKAKDNVHSSNVLVHAVAGDSEIVFAVESAVC